MTYYYLPTDPAFYVGFANNDTTRCDRSETLFGLIYAERRYVASYRTLISPAAEPAFFRESTRGQSPVRPAGRGSLKPCCGRVRVQRAR